MITAPRDISAYVSARDKASNHAEILAASESERDDFLRDQELSRSNIQSVNEMLSSLQTCITAKDRAANTQKQHVTNLQEQLAGLKQQLRDACRKRDELSDELLHGAKDYDTLKQENERQKQENERQRQDMERQRKDNMRKADRSKSIISDLTHSLETLQTEYSRLQEEQEKLPGQQREDAIEITEQRRTEVKDSDERDREVVAMRKKCSMLEKALQDSEKKRKQAQVEAEEEADQMATIVENMRHAMVEQLKDLREEHEKVGFERDIALAKLHNGGKLVEFGPPDRRSQGSLDDKFEAGAEDDVFGCYDCAEKDAVISMQLNVINELREALEKAENQEGQDKMRRNGASLGNGSAKHETKKVNTLHVKITLGMNFGKVGKQGSVERLEFEEDFVQDVAGAAGIPRERVLIKDLSPGSVIVTTCIQGDASGSDPSVLDVAIDLIKQAADPNSQLRSGKVTQHLTVLATDVNTDTDTDTDNLQDCLRQLQEAQTSIEQHKTAMDEKKCLLDEKNAEMELLKISVEKMENDIMQLRKEKERPGQEGETRIEQNQAAMAKQKSLLDENKAQMALEKTTNEQLKSNIEQLKDTVEVLRKEKEKAGQEGDIDLHGMALKLARLGRERHEMKSSRDHIQGEMYATKKSYEQQIEDLTYSVQAADSRFEELQDKTRSLSLRVDELTRKLALSETKNDQIKRERESLKLKSRDVEVELETAYEDTRTLQMRYDELLNVQAMKTAKMKLITEETDKAMIAKSQVFADEKLALESAYDQEREALREERRREREKWEEERREARGVQEEFQAKMDKECLDLETKLGSEKQQRGLVETKLLDATTLLRDYLAQMCQVPAHIGSQQHHTDELTQLIRTYADEFESLKTTHALELSHAGNQHARTLEAKDSDFEKLKSTHASELSHVASLHTRALEAKEKGLEAAHVELKDVAEALKGLQGAEEILRRKVAEFQEGDKLWSAAVEQLER